MLADSCALLTHERSSRSTGSSRSGRAMDRAIWSIEPAERGAIARDVCSKRPGRRVNGPIPVELPRRCMAGAPGVQDQDPRSRLVASVGRTKLSAPQSSCAGRLVRWVSYGIDNNAGAAHIYAGRQHHFCSLHMVFKNGRAKVAHTAAPTHALPRPGAYPARWEGFAGWVSTSGVYRRSLPWVDLAAV